MSRGPAPIIHVGHCRVPRLAAADRGVHEQRVEAVLELGLQALARLAARLELLLEVGVIHHGKRLQVCLCVCCMLRSVAF